MSGLQNKMKRKVVAFPPASGKSGVSTCSSGSCSVSVASVAVKKPCSTTSMVDKSADLITLLSFLPERHDRSIQLSMQVEGISNGLIEGISIEDHYTANPGLVRITIGVNPRYDESGDCSNYGFSTWEFIVGGQGPGYDVVVGIGDTRSLLQEECAAPVAVRFSTPIAHVLVDDMGFLDNVVWTSLGSTADIPTLLQIVNMVGELLLGSARARLQEAGELRGDVVSRSAPRTAQALCSAEVQGHHEAP